MGAAVAALSPDRIVTSDLARARVTAESVGRVTGIRVELDPRFREIHAGRWQGLTAEEVAERWPEERAAVLRGEDVRRGGDGESMQDVARPRRRGPRRPCWRNLPAGACAVVSTHGAAAAGRGRVDARPRPRGRLAGAAGLGNCHWGELHEGRAGWRLQTWNASSGVAARPGSSPP